MSSHSPLRTQLNSLARRCVAVLLACTLALDAHAAPPEAGLAFSARSPIYEADLTPAGVTDQISVELWVRPDPDCPEGAVILDRMGPGTHQGIRLEMGAGGTLRLLASSRKQVETGARLPTDRFTHVLATFNPRERLIAIYLNQRLAASLPHDPKLRIDATGVQAPLRLGADFTGKRRFKGQIAHVAVYDKAMAAADVARLVGADGTGPRPVAAWKMDAGSGAAIAPALGSAALAVPADIAASSSPVPNPLTLWYRQPAREWLESLPFGNGRLGGTVFGGVDRERIQFNEDTIWSGSPYDPANPDAPKALKEIRRLLFAGKQKEAEELTLKSAMGKPLRMANYQTLGSLALDFPSDGGPVTDYRRSLDIDSAISTTTYKRAGVTLTREVFSSAPDQVVVVRITADKPGSISFRASMFTPFTDATLGVQDGLLSRALHP